MSATGVLDVARARIRERALDGAPAARSMSVASSSNVVLFAACHIEDAATTLGRPPPDVRVDDFATYTKSRHCEPFAEERDGTSARIVPRKMLITPE